MNPTTARRLSRGLTGDARAIARAAERLLSLRPDRPTSPSPHARMAAALYALHAARAATEGPGPTCEQCRKGVDLDTGRCACPGRAWGLPVVDVVPDAVGLPRWEGRPERAPARLVAAGLRHGYHLS